MKTASKKQIEKIEINEEITIECSECGDDVAIDKTLGGICENCQGLNDDKWDFED